MKLRISHKINLISALGVVGVLAVGGLYYLNRSAEHALHDAISESKSVTEALRAVEGDLMRMRLEDQEFLLTPDLRLVENHKNHVTHISEKFSSLEQFLKTHNDEKISSVQKQFVEDVGQYDRSFQEMVAIQTQMGLTPDAGLEGSLRKSVHEIETLLKKYDSQALRADMLTLRRNEKD